MKQNKKQNIKHKALKLVLVAQLVLVLSLSAACAAKYETVAVFVPKFSEDRMMDTIKLLASEDNARITGFEGEQKSADYVTEQFKTMGLEVSEQSFPIKAYVCENISLKVTSDADKAIQDVKALSYSAATPAGGLRAEVISLGMGADADYADKEVTGKVVLIQRGGEFFYIKTARAFEKGAAAVLFYDPNGESAISATLTQLSAIPAVSIARSEAVSLEKAIADGSAVAVELVVDVIHEDSTSKNVIGFYKSPNNPEGKRVVVGAHYDGVDTPAANDNGSGMAVVIEIAKTLTEQKIALPYDVQFVAFGAEEIGLIGSETFVDEMKLAERKTILAMLNFDMVGVGDTFDIATVEGTNNTELVDLTNETLIQMGYTPVFSETDRSDHAPFSNVGIQAINIQWGPFHDYHTDKDTIEGINPELLTKSCELGTKLLVDELPKKFK